MEGNVPSSKNSKQWTGKFLISSKTTRTYQKNTEWLWAKWRPTFKAWTNDLPKPYRVHFRFVRDSHRKFDYVNPLQTVQDLMVKHKWIEDDNADELLPVLEPYRYSKEYPGVEIWIEKKAQL